MAYCVGGMHLVGAKGGAKWGQRTTDGEMVVQLPSRNGQPA
jgi:hypothetical protein